MSDTFLDSTVAIGLIFRNAGERKACEAALQDGCHVVASRYVLFEIARGFLRRLITMHNVSFEFQTLADMQNAASLGQRRFTYEMQTWINAIADYLAELEKEDGPTSEKLKLDEFRAKMRGWIRRGWRQLHTKFELVNDIGCRSDIAPPFQRADQMIDQRLPVAECGIPTACSLQQFMHERREEVTLIISCLNSLTKSKKDAETEGRIESLHDLISTPIGSPFLGKKCHRCGDALICLEAPADSVIATKNQKHFEPIASALGKKLIVAKHATTTTVKSREPGN